MVLNEWDRFDAKRNDMENPKIQIESVIDHLGTDIKRALEATIEELYPEARVDRHEAFRVFKRMVGRMCSTWVDIPSRFLKE